MKALTAGQMADIEGRSFLAGFACGAGIIASIAAIGSPVPLTRWVIWSTTIVACGSLF